MIYLTQAVPAVFLPRRHTASLAIATYPGGLLDGILEGVHSVVG